MRRVDDVRDLPLPHRPDKTGPRMDGEDDMLDCAVSEVTETSRLSCQVKLTPDMDGLRVILPEEQI